MFHSGQVFHELVCPLTVFFLRFSSISLHCSPIQFTFAFFMHLMMLLFTSLYFSDPSSSNRFFLSSLLLSHRSRIAAVTQGFFSFEPSQPQRTTSGQNTNFNLFPSYSFTSHQTTSLFSQTTAQTLSTISERKTRKTITCFGAYLSSASAQHGGNPHTAG